MSLSSPYEQFEAVWYLAEQEEDRLLVFYIQDQDDGGVRLYQRKRSRPNWCARCSKMINKGDVAVYLSDTVGYGCFNLYYRMCSECWEHLRPLMHEEDIAMWIANELEWRQTRKDDKARAVRRAEETKRCQVARNS